MSSDETWGREGGAEQKVHLKRNEEASMAQMRFLFLGCMPTIQHSSQYNLFPFSNSCLPAWLFEKHQHINCCWQRMVCIIQLEKEEYRIRRNIRVKYLKRKKIQQGKQMTETRKAFHPESIKRENFKKQNNQSIKCYR